ncbi:unnamed protein product [Prorocentrum cordatum]|uniref:ABC transmembrane type-1 domain-containing protein n=1 Tax=Prorocentrum cordatum TaxID=2364126 RepID=A0ABN9XYU5_9DINO|nr:unnamed protein product [Polarella glacialis]
MPLVVLKVLTGLCLLWGWPRVAVLLAAGFAGIVRAAQLFLDAGDPQLVQGRGRWMSQKVMLIYLQERVSTTYMSELPAATRDGISQMASQVWWMWPQAVAWLREGAPASSWPSMWCSMRPPS